MEKEKTKLIWETPVLGELVVHKDTTSGGTGNQDGDSSNS